ncbi:hypothetical protein K461DRAFT_294563 [Myriangium duriaei CBS 260.36]|uniref:Uncharacterized protein n=1 Tax=Myriangium duriaei CBS 260.36 TaxID=1168546 RepID=A0A9P4MG10_9PEZI|nr:hypothetical protein K461DRAFT_294563 [Myriangium duriaei CBS 260.36]
MAQGTVKVKANSSKPTKPTGPQRGNRVIKPKNAKLLQQHKLKKKQSAGLAAMTEKSLAERAGHLEMLKGGKKDSKTASKANKTKK